jgi:hypothetical protein
MDLQKVKDDVLAFGGYKRRCRRNYQECLVDLNKGAEGFIKS